MAVYLVKFIYSRYFCYYFVKFENYFWPDHYRISVNTLTGRPLYGSMAVTQSIRIPPVVTPDREEVTLPTVSEKLIHKWTPFGAGN